MILMELLILLLLPAEDIPEVNQFHLGEMTCILYI